MISLARLTASEESQCTDSRMPPFVTLRFVLRDAEADQCASESADGAADTDARQCGHDRSSSDERAYARDRQCADSSEQAERAAEHSAGTCSGGRALRCFGGFFGSNLPGPKIFREQGGYIARGKSGANERVGGVIGARQRGINPEDCGFFAGHV